ncbi:hypothetical protein M8C21_023914 [Ambrosia artemisiifolia]|uniref:Uncharacterized protein n=1 Tax=Ambrosia artemisiifolia TaxID=4212 RepID=A0AAD5D7N8_AMBAR|nr:hypothetical protein M8C21_023914 [Ambrosia artemisiifolia]
MTTATTGIQPPLLRPLTTATILHISSYSFALTASSPSRRFAVRSTNPKSDDSFISQDDVRFLLKLGAGSFAGAAAIKYGSILVPEITRPNIIQALLMISTPVVVAIVLLIKESRRLQQ